MKQTNSLNSWKCKALQELLQQSWNIALRGKIYGKWEQKLKILSVQELVNQNYCFAKSTTTVTILRNQMLKKYFYIMACVARETSLKHLHCIN